MCQYFVQYYSHQTFRDFFFFGGVGVGGGAFVGVSGLMGNGGFHNLILCSVFMTKAAKLNNELAC